MQWLVEWSEAEHTLSEATESLPPLPTPLQERCPMVRHWCRLPGRSDFFLCSFFCGRTKVPPSCAYSPFKFIYSSFEVQDVIIYSCNFFFQQNTFFSFRIHFVVDHTPILR